MNILDLILIVIILGCGAWGWKNGFIEALGTVVGIVVSSAVASRFYLTIGGWLGDSNLAYVMAFVAIFFIVAKAISLLFWAFGKVFKIITLVPFLKQFDKILGVIVGLVNGILILSIVLYFMSKYPLNEWLTAQMQGSILTSVLLLISYIFLPLLPEALKKLKSLI